MMQPPGLLRTLRALCVRIPKHSLRGHTLWVTMRTRANTTRSFARGPEGGYGRLPPIRMTSTTTRAGASSPAHTPPWRSMTFVSVFLTVLFWQDALHDRARLRCPRRSVRYSVAPASREDGYTGGHHLRVYVHP